jgi:hemoglobin-like flavoprotein
VTDADAALVLASLDIVAGRRGDPTADVYATLFSVHPELEALFVMDRDGGVRASMMQQALECIADLAGDRLVAPQIIAASRMHHEGYGVPAERFDAFLVAIRDTCRTIAGTTWTAETDRAWERMLEAFAGFR